MRCSCCLIRLLLLLAGLAWRPSSIWAKRAYRPAQGSARTWRVCSDKLVARELWPASRRDAHPMRTRARTHTNAHTLNRTQCRASVSRGLYSLAPSANHPRTCSLACLPLKNPPHLHSTVPPRLALADPVACETRRWPQRRWKLSSTRYGHDARCLPSTSSSSLFTHTLHRPLQEPHRTPERMASIGDVHTGYQVEEEENPWAATGAEPLKRRSSTHSPRGGRRELDSSVPRVSINPTGQCSEQAATLFSLTSLLTC